MRKFFVLVGLFLVMAGAAAAQNEFPRVETSPAFMYIRVSPGGGLSDWNCVGGGGTIALNLNKWVGLATDLGGCSTTGLQSGLSVKQFTYLFRPRFTYRNNSRFQPFFEVNFGGDRLSASCTNIVTTRGTCNGNLAWNAFGMTAGGGFDIKLSKKISWRVVQAEYFYTRFGNNVAVLNNVNQNNFRLKSGIVINWGGNRPKAPDVVTASCSVDKSSIMADSGDMISAMAQGSDSYSHPINYTWAATGGKVDGSGPQVRWQSAGVAPGTYTISAHLDDGRGNNASCSSDVTVSPKPVPPAPTMSCSADPSSVQAGERSAVTATVNDSTNTALTYAWQANSGQVVGTGASVQFDSTGLAPGDYTVTGRATNANGAAADCTTTVTIQQPPAKPEASKVGQCTFKLNSARVDNVCKRVLDDAAVRLQNDPKAKIVIVGYSDPKEKKADKLAKDRADSASMYLSKTKNVDASRVETRTTAGTAGADTENRRVDVMNVPDGATF